MRTLCSPCHLKVTAESKRRWADERRVAAARSHHAAAAATADERRLGCAQLADPSLAENFQGLSAVFAPSRGGGGRAAAAAQAQAPVQQPAARDEAEEARAFKRQRRARITKIIFESDSEEYAPVAAGSAAVDVDASASAWAQGPETIATASSPHPAHPLARPPREDSHDGGTYGGHGGGSAASEEQQEPPFRQPLERQAEEAAAVSGGGRGSPSSSTSPSVRREPKRICTTRGGPLVPLPVLTQQPTSD